MHESLHAIETRISSGLTGHLARPTDLTRGSGEEVGWEAELMWSCI